MSSPKKIAGIGDAAVIKATGQGWDYWLKALDKIKASKLTHKEIALYLKEKQGISLWWSQMITVGYEQARGMRVAHQQPDGFEITKSKTLPISAAKAFKGWHDKKTRDIWLNEKITIKKSTQSKSIRLIWSDGKSSVDVNFYGKERNKCQVSVQHTRLSSASHAERMKKYWSEKLEDFKSVMIP